MPPAMVPNLSGQRLAMKPSTTMVAIDVIHPSVRARAWQGVSGAGCLFMRATFTRRALSMCSQRILSKLLSPCGKRWDAEGKAEMVFSAGKWKDGRLVASSNQHLPPREPSPKDLFWRVAPVTKERCGVAVGLLLLAAPGAGDKPRRPFSCQATAVCWETARTNDRAGRQIRLGGVAQQSDEQTGLDLKVRSGSLIRPSKLHMKRRQHAYDMGIHQLPAALI